MKFVFNPDVILCGRLGSKHQLTNFRDLSDRFDRHFVSIFEQRIAILEGRYSVDLYVLLL